MLTLRVSALSLIVGLATASAGTSEPAYRLDGLVVPSIQRVELTVDARETSYSGSVSADVTVVSEIRSFLLNAEDIEISSIELRRDDARIPLAVEQKPEGIVELTADRPITAGTYELTATFTNEFNTQAVGLYRLESDGEAYTFTQFQAVDARKAFPCWDEPNVKIPYEVTITVPAEHEAFSNTPVRADTRDGDLRRVAFARTKPIPVYLVAMATGPLEQVPVEGLRVPGRIITKKGQSHLVDHAAEITPRIFDALEEYFGRPYPYAKLDQVAVPEFWPGAMENAGLITYRESALAVDRARLTVGQRRWQAEVIAHEVAHQWFGDLVTMEWWDDLWLNESFATWMATKICADLFPELDFDVESVRGGIYAMSTDAQLSTRAIRRPIEKTANLLESADALAYEKGERVLGMFEQWMGPEAFRDGVRAYLDAHAFGNATADDLWAALSESAGHDVGTAMATFLDQPGVPIVAVRDLGGGRVRIDQRRFFNYGAEEAETNEQTWRVPIVLRYADAEQVYDQEIMLVDRSQTFELETDNDLAWLHPNVGESGYYHWMVEPGVLESLAENAPDILDVRERVGLLGHISALMDAGLVHGDEFLALLELQAADPDPQVMRSLLGALMGVRGAFVTPELEDAFGLYVARFLAPSLEAYGLFEQPGEPEAVTQFRPQMLGALARYARDARVVEQMHAWAETYLIDPDAVPASIVGTALAVSAMQGDMALFEQYRARFESAATPAERSRFLNTLGEFEDPALLQAALDYVLTGPLRPQEIFSIPMAIGGDDYTYGDVLWTWMTEHHAEILGRIPPPIAMYLVWFGGGCERELIARVTEYFEQPGKSVPGTESELAKVVESIENCAGLREREGDRVARFFADFASRAERPSTARGM